MPDIKSVPDPSEEEEYTDLTRPMNKEEYAQALDVPYNDFLSQAQGFNQALERGSDFLREANKIHAANQTLLKENEELRKRKAALSDQLAEEQQKSSALERAIREAQDEINARQELLLRHYRMLLGDEVSIDKIDAILTRQLDKVKNQT